MTKKKFKNILGFLGLLSLVSFSTFKKRKDILHGMQEQKDHLVKALKQEEQECEHYLKRLRRKIKSSFIPHQDNDHKPTLLHSKKLVTYVIILIAVKVAVTGFLFLYYPSQASLAQIVTSKIIELANKDRQSNGVQTLEVDLDLSRFALAKAADMIEKGYFSHETPDGKKPWQFIQRDSYDYVYAGENLAMDFTSAELIHQAFMKSPTHRKNILNPKYQNIGIAVVSGELNGRQTDLLVQFFGTRREQSSTLASIATPQEINKLRESIIEPEVDDNLENAIGSEKQIVVAGQETVFEETDESYAAAGPGIIVVSAQSTQKTGLVDSIVELTNVLFIAFLIFISALLFLAVVIKIKVQHPKLIVQTLVVIALVSALILVKFHFIEGVGNQFMIL